MGAHIVGLLLLLLTATMGESSYYYSNTTSLPKIDGSVAAIVLSFNHKSNVERITKLLIAEPAITTIVVAEDGSTDGSYDEWKKWLRPQDKIVRSNDVHEIRAYNGASKVAEASILCFLQDDDLPDAKGWASEVGVLMNAFRAQRLAVISGLAAEVCNLELGETDVDHPKAMKNNKRTQRIPYLYEGIPFAFATEAWLSPMCVRKEIFEALGGFDETLTHPGEPGIGLDIHLSIRAAAEMGLTVGVHGATFNRGVGGHGTVSDPKKAALRLRKREEISARIRQVAGCRWPPEMLRRAAALNAALLKERPGHDATRLAIKKSCASFLTKPCNAAPKHKRPPRTRRPLASNFRRKQQPAE